MQYSEDREEAGPVVKPIWLLMMTWTAPPVRYPRSWDRLRVSVTTPWPINAASPWIRIGRTEKPSPPRSNRSCLALTTPSKTGLTASRWEGLAAMYTLVGSPLGEV